MSEQNFTEGPDHVVSGHELDSQDTNRNVSAPSESDKSNPQTRFAWIVTVSIIALFTVVGLVWIASQRSTTTAEVELSQPEAGKDDGLGREVTLEPETLASAGIEIESVTQRPAVAKLFVTGSVELNPEKTEAATPLVGGRI